MSGYWDAIDRALGFPPAGAAAEAGPRPRARFEPWGPEPDDTLAEAVETAASPAADPPARPDPRAEAEREGAERRIRRRRAGKTTADLPPREDAGERDGTAVPPPLRAEPVAGRPADADAGRGALAPDDPAVGRAAEPAARHAPSRDPEVARAAHGETVRPAPPRDDRDARTGPTEATMPVTLALPAGDAERAAAPVESADGDDRGGKVDATPAQAASTPISAWDGDDAGGPGAAPEPAPLVIEIGHIEIRLVAEAPPPRPAAPAPAPQAVLPLADYLARRGGTP